MDMIKAALLGVIEGITEWLPISSTGHMILAERLLQMDQTPEFMQMFRVVIQLGAIAAVVVLYWNRLWPVVRHPDGQITLKMPSVRLWMKIAVATLPALVLGLLLDDWLDAHFYNYVTVAAMLILYGILFILVERQNIQPCITKVAQITWMQALIIGLWQVLAMIPGTSRSGATIVGGLLLGLSRPAVAEFTFFLAVPVMFGASLLKVVKYLGAGLTLGLPQLGLLLVGCAAAFGVSIVAIRFLMDYVKKHDFKFFGLYRMALGAVVLVMAVINGLFL
ncbi:MAG: undecaprenyl-diphosphate phosphatase [Faecalibacterium sp.]|nr:undecaprenyl-diphosphate phosphatase [Faecalibacterium sp.]